MENYQVIVIGGGTAGYVAAIRAAQLGFNTVCIDKWINKQGKPALGGTCLNVGCIPSKALLDSTHHYEDVVKHASVHGIDIGKASFKPTVMIERKDTIVSQLTMGISQLFKANKVTWLAGTAQLQADKSVIFTDHDKQQKVLTADAVILASGSVASPFKGVDFDGEYIINSEQALNWDKAPKRLAVIGAGAIGLEMGSVWRRIGSETAIYKARKGLLPEADPDITKAATRELKKQGMIIHDGLSIDKVEVKKKGVDIHYTPNGGKAQVDRYDRVLVAVGRSPFTTGLLAENTGIVINDRGFIEVNDDCETAMKGVYAIGDVVRGPMLAHKGSEEGIAVAERIAGQQPHIDYNCIPMVIYTHPEIAWVGETQVQAEARGVEVKTGKFSFMANGRAKAANNTAGLIKVVADKKTDRVLGVHIFGSTASELIGQAVIAMECQCTVEDLQRTVFAHPSLSEALHEAVLDVDKRMIHAVSR